MHELYGYGSYSWWITGGATWAFLLTFVLSNWREWHSGARALGVVGAVSLVALITYLDGGVSALPEVWYVIAGTMAVVVVCIQRSPRLRDKARGSIRPLHVGMLAALALGSLVVAQIGARLELCEASCWAAEETLPPNQSTASYSLVVRTQGRGAVWRSKKEAWVSRLLSTRSPLEVEVLDAIGEVATDRALLDRWRESLTFSEKHLQNRVADLDSEYKVFFLLSAEVEAALLREDVRAALSRLALMGTVADDFSRSSALGDTAFALSMSHTILKYVELCMGHKAFSSDHHTAAVTVLAPLVTSRAIRFVQVGYRDEIRTLRFIMRMHGTASAYITTGEAVTALGLARQVKHASIKALEASTAREELRMVLGAEDEWGSCEDQYSGLIAILESAIQDEALRRSLLKQLRVSGVD